jgi:hypothetical protein
VFAISNNLLCWKKHRLRPKFHEFFRSAPGIARRFGLQPPLADRLPFSERTEPIPYKQDTALAEVMQKVPGIPPHPENLGLPSFPFLTARKPGRGPDM